MEEEQTLTNPGATPCGSHYRTGNFPSCAVRSSSDLRHISLKVHNMVEWFGLKGILKIFQAPAMGKDIFHWIRLLKAPSILALEGFFLTSSGSKTRPLCPAVGLSVNFSCDSKIPPAWVLIGDLSGSLKSQKNSSLLMSCSSCLLGGCISLICVPYCFVLSFVGTK